MVTSWTPENDQKLLIAILSTIEKPIPCAQIAELLIKMGFESTLTAKAVRRRLEKLKEINAAGKAPASTNKTTTTPATPEKKGKASASSTPANTEKKRKRALDDIGFGEVAQGTPMHDESPAKRLLSDSNDIDFHYNKGRNNAHFMGMLGAFSVDDPPLPVPLPVHNDPGPPAVKSEPEDNDIEGYLYTALINDKANADHAHSQYNAE